MLTGFLEGSNADSLNWSMTTTNYSTTVYNLEINANALHASFAGANRWSGRSLRLLLIETPSLAQDFSMADPTRLAKIHKFQPPQFIASKKENKFSFCPTATPACRTRPASAFLA